MKRLNKKLTIPLVALLVAVVFVSIGVNRPEEPTTQKQSIEPQTERQTASIKRRESQAQKLARLAMERGGLPIDQALNQAASERHRKFAQKDMAYQRQTAEESRSIAMDRLSEVGEKLARASDPKQVAVLTKQVEMLRQIVQRFE